MRLRGWWFAGALAIVCLLAGARWAERTWRSLGVHGASDEGALRSLAFAIPDGGELEFDLPGGVDRVRLFAHAEVAPEVALVEQSATRPFALRLRYVGWGGAEEEREYHFRSRVTRAISPTGASIARTRFLRTPRQPLDPRGTLLSLRGLEFQASRLYVSIESLDPALVGVSVRLYFESEIGESKRLAHWSRLSGRDRERRAVGNIYPHYLLTDHERASLVAERWSPLAPSGVPGADYERRIVLLSELELDAIARDEEGPQGPPAGVVAVARLSEEELFEFEAFTSAGLPRAVLVSPSGERRPVGEPLGARTLRIASVGEPGWLEVSADDTVELRRVGTGAIQSALAIESIQSFGCSGEPIAYRVVHVGDRPTPVRIDLRAIDGVATKATARLLSEGRDEIAAIEIASESELSTYDWVDDEGGSRRVSDVVRRYLSVPTDVSEVEISCEEGGLVSFYNQLPDLVLRTELPRASAGATRRWGLVLPLEAAALHADGRSYRLRLQQRPTPLRRPRSADERLQTYPIDGAVGRHILTELADPGVEGGTWRFRELAEGRPIPVEVADLDRGGARPLLLFRREGTSGFPLRVEIDGEVVHDAEWAGRQGAVELPKLPAGPIEISVAGDGATRFYLNSVRGAAGRHFVRRWVDELPDGAFELDLPKRGDLVLTGRLFFPVGAANGCRLDASVLRSRAAGRGFDDWTYLKRRFDVAPPRGDRVALLAGDALWLERSEPFYLRLGRDLPDGSIRVRFTPQCSGPIYLTLSQLAAGTARERRLIYESGLEASG